MRLLFSLLLPGLFMLALPACATPLTYSAKEIRGQIVDDDTSEPLEEVVIVAQWILYHIGMGHGGHKSRIHIHETVTDKQGHYVIPAWGPKVRAPLSELTDRDPVLSIFKSGYTPTGLLNARESKESLRVSDWDGKVIRLKRVSDQELEQYASRLISLYDGLVEDMRNDYEWKKYRQMTMAVYKEYQMLKTKGLRVYRPSIPYVEEFVDPKRN